MKAFLPISGSLLACAALVFVVAPVNGGQRGYGANISEGLVANMVSRFGQPARPRLATWSSFLRDAKGNRPSNPAAERALLVKVNDHFNRIRFVSDMKHWNEEDFWASPAETVATYGGDCEDFAIAKYFALKELGIPVSRLRISYVKATRINQAHMVLAYYPTPDADPLILDNLEKELKPGSQRPDLIPVYSFNDDDIWLARSPTVRSGSSSQIRLWRELVDKLDREALL